MARRRSPGPSFEGVMLALALLNIPLFIAMLALFGV